MGNGWSTKLGWMGNHGVAAQLFVCCVSLIVSAYSAVFGSSIFQALYITTTFFFVEDMKIQIKLIGWLVFGYRDTRT
jgi:hypothetical protein